MGLQWDAMSLVPGWPASVPDAGSRGGLPSRLPLQRLIDFPVQVQTVVHFAERVSRCILIIPAFVVCAVTLVFGAYLDFWGHPSLPGDSLLTHWQPLCTLPCSRESFHLSPAAPNPVSSTWRRTSWRSPAVVSRALGCRKTHQLPFPFPWSDETLESFVSLPRCMHHGQIVWVLIEEGGVWCAVLRGVEGPLHSQKHLVEYQTRLAGCTCSLSTARRLGPRWSQFWCQTPETGSVSYCPSFPLPVKFPSENSLLKY